MEKKEIKDKINEFIDKQEIDLFMIVTAYIEKGQERCERMSKEHVLSQYRNGNYNCYFMTPEYMRDLNLAVIDLASLEGVVRYGILAKVLKNMI